MRVQGHQVGPKHTPYPLGDAATGIVVRRLRRWQRLARGLLLSWIPAGAAAWYVIGSVEVVPILLVLWGVILAGVGTVIKWTPCPRCGGYFNMRNPPFQTSPVMNLFRQRCVHCGFEASVTDSGSKPGHITTDGTGEGHP
jgi:hypothetical protein